jgi:uncharacterized glyoxalase superfamily metalloenzyme YdcJ
MKKAYGAITILANNLDCTHPAATQLLKNPAMGNDLDYHDPDSAATECAYVTRFARLPTVDSWQVKCVEYRLYYLDHDDV